MDAVFRQPFGEGLPYAIRAAGDDCVFVLVAFGQGYFRRNVVIAGPRAARVRVIPIKMARCPPKRDGRDKPGHDECYICIARLATAIAASLTASDSVGCAWQVRAMSSEDAPNSMAMTASAIMLPASAQISCTPRTRSVFASAKIFTKPSLVKLTLARPLAVKGNLPTLYAIPAVLHSSLLFPTVANYG